MQNNVKKQHLGSDSTVLRTDTKVPLYQQIFVILQNKIQSGELAAGETIAGEKELCDEFGVSRITARRALNELAQSGLVDRKRGRGTRVLAQSNVQPLVASMDGLLENVQHIGRTTTVRVLKHGKARAGIDVARALDVDEAATVVRSIRVRDLAEAPMSYLMTWVPEDIGELIAGQDMSRTPLLLLLEEAGVDVTRAQQTVTATIADPEVALALDIPAGAPLIDVRRIVSDRTQRPVEYIRILYRPEFYRFEMTMQRVEGQVGKRWTASDDIALEGPA
ncbi:MAG: GntR family transcriptional regulator [Arenibacterium sp.]